MCLLKPGQPNASCLHNECKTFYMLNKQNCLYNLNPTKPLSDSNSQSSENSSTQTQISPFSLNRPSAFTSKVSPIHLKKLLAGKSELSTDEESDQGTTNKKLKTEDNSAKMNANTIPLNAFIQANMTPNNFTISHQAGLINYPTNPAGVKPFGQNLTCQNLINTPQGLLSLQQDPQINLFNNIPASTNIQYKCIPVPLQPYSQPVYTNLDAINQSTKTSETQNTSNKVEDAFKEVLSNTLNAFSNQTMILSELNEKTDLVQDTLACLISEVHTLKKSVQGSTQEKNMSSHSKRNITPVFSLNETITSEELLKFLYGRKSDFEYQIMLEYDLELPLYRERNFGFSIKLVDKEGQLVENVNRIPLTLSAYTCENPPKYLDVNTAGNRIFKGFVEVDLVKGMASFERIQIKEVSSHFRNGWIFLVVHPKTSKNYSYVTLNEKNGENVDIKKIKPLILERVVVKAKKLKEKDELGESKSATEI